MDKLQYLNYLRNLSIDSELNCFVLPWCSVILRNCDESGELYSPAALKDYRVHVKCMWVLLKAAVFRDQLGVYGVLCCENRGCGSMQGILELRYLQKLSALLFLSFSPPSLLLACPPLPCPPVVLSSCPPVLSSCPVLQSCPGLSCPPLYLVLTVSLPPEG